MVTNALTVSRFREGYFFEMTLTIRSGGRRSDPDKVRGRCEKHAPFSIHASTFEDMVIAQGAARGVSISRPKFASVVCDECS
jgi:hypothetical protein